MESQNSHRVTLIVIGLGQDVDFSILKELGITKE